VLAEIDVPEMAPEYAGAEADVERAKANVAHAQADLERAQAELELKQITYERLRSIREQERDVLPQQQVDEAKAQFEVARAMVNVAESKIKVAQGEAAKAEAARARLSTLMAYTKIRAPFDGVVTKRYVDPGALIQHASSQTNVSPVVTVARVETLRIFVDVTEPDVPFIKRGIPVTLAVDAMPGKVYRGTCTRFATALDPKTRTMRTEIDIPNRDGLLRPGMFGRVKLGLERRSNALTVPASALLIESGKTYVYTVEHGKARRVEVKTGFDDGIQVEVTGGLTGDEPIIISGQSSVKDGAPVKASQS
jgi:RND family efflux transporter MFP subunit